MGYFIDLDLVGLNWLRQLILHWVVVLSAVAVLVGFANLFRTHWNKTTNRKPGSGFSLVTLVAMILTLVFVGFFGPTDPLSIWIFNNIQLPIEISLLAILAVVLIVASVRFLSRSPGVFSVIFISTVVVLIWGVASFPGLDFINFSSLRTWILQIPATAGARGLLLGVALGTIATGLRVLLGMDRPYEG